MRSEEDVPLGAPDTYALRRRVLLAGVVTLALFFACAYAIAWSEDFEHTGNDGFLVVAAVLIYLLVTRPLMRPVRDAVKLRRRLAYEAWADERRRQEPP